MEVDNKIYHSDITRVYKKQNSDLLELLTITPAVPLSQKINETDTCVFEPKCDKYYVPKVRSKVKVRTVRDIRNLFEQDNYRNIVEDIEKQQTVLLSKIRNGSSHHSTKKFASKLLKAEHPISRTTWQMLKNINPENNLNSTQYVLWNSTRIRVVGSKGGKAKFICKYELDKKYSKNEKTIIGFEKNKKKHGLLRNSLNIRFKPGPLGRKKNLDYSHQKYNMGPIELVKLPKPALEIQPTFGKIVEPVMAHFLNKLRPENGTISEKWAEFAVSVLGTVTSNKPIQTDQDHCVTFDLSYKCAQHRILMRRNNCNLTAIAKHDVTPEKYQEHNIRDETTEIKSLISDILNSVEVSLNQDCMYTIEKESSPITTEPTDTLNINIPKEKTKKKYGELDRLAVTVIQIPGTPEMSYSKPCTNAYCILGCVCESLNFTYKLKQHCGNVDCMFECQCKIPKFKDIDLLEKDCPDFIPGLMSLDNEINANLAKEEQKFHQTVVFSGERSILLKPRKRSTKISKKYDDFHSDLLQKNEIKQKKILAIVDKKLNCENIEPWCMVHNLYRCFCKGRFIDSATVNLVNATPKSISIPTVDLINKDSLEIPEYIEYNILNEKDEMRPLRNANSKCNSLNLLEISNDQHTLSNRCAARVIPYCGRTHDYAYYKIMNDKIRDIEKNDTMLHRKMMKLMKIPVQDQELISMPNEHEATTSEKASLLETERAKADKDVIENENQIRGVKYYVTGNKLHKNGGLVNLFQKVLTSDLSKPNSSNIEQANIIIPVIEHEIPFEISGDMYKPVLRKTQNLLKPWIEKSYKNYIENLSSGKFVLERPRKGKITLHLFKNLLERYKSRRNYFLTTLKHPCRTFIATDPKNPFFKDCININTIRYADLRKYPNVVKNFLTNVANEDTFCILGGWDDCWEIIGCVKKNANEAHMCDSDASNNESPSHDSDYAEENWWNEQDAIDPESEGPENLQKDVLAESKAERSKWFLMKLERDFTDIYCHKRGFYVEYIKLIHAINLARLTHKTVVINKQETAETENIPFGIYALPMIKESWAIVGPYEVEEPLGLEILKSKTVPYQNCTKGFWLTTNKVDNVKVLHDPMLFLTQNSMCKGSKISIPGNLQPTTSELKNVENIDAANGVIKVVNKRQDVSDIKMSENIIPKLVKIKVRKTNGFHHLTPKNNLFNSRPSTSNLLLDVNCFDTKSPSKDQVSMNKKSNNSETEVEESLLTCDKSIVPQIKITSVYSENVEENAKLKQAMFILRPEEINKKIAKQKEVQKPSDEDKINVDIANFLRSPKPSTSVDSDDCLVISDDDDEVDTRKTCKKWTDVWIQCSNVNNLKWIRAKKNEDNLLCVDFPGFEANKLYSEREALSKINNTMSKKISKPETLELKWKVSESKIYQFGTKRTLNNNSSRIHFKNNKLRKKRIRIVKKSAPLQNDRTHELFAKSPNAIFSNENTELMDGLEETSRLLEDKSVLLLNQAKMNYTEISDNINVPEGSKLEMSETLHNIMTVNDKLGDNDILSSEISEYISVPERSAENLKAMNDELGDDVGVSSEIGESIPEDCKIEITETLQNLVTIKDEFT